MKKKLSKEEREKRIEEQKRLARKLVEISKIIDGDESDDPFMQMCDGLINSVTKKVDSKIVEQYSQIDAMAMRLALAWYKMGEITIKIGDDTIRIVASKICHYYTSEEDGIKWFNIVTESGTKHMIGNDEMAYSALMYYFGL